MQTEGKIRLQTTDILKCISCNFHYRVVTVNTVNRVNRSEN